MKKVKLTKVWELEDAEVPNNVAEGDVVEGVLMYEPEIGKPIYILRPTGKARRTSIVTEILPANGYKTLNSVYKIEYVI